MRKIGFIKGLLLSLVFMLTQGQALARYVQADPIGLEGGFNRFGYVSGNPLSYVDPMGLTQADIDNAFIAAQNMMPGARFPLAINTWSQRGKGGKYSFWDKSIYVDAKYLDCLDDGEAGGLLLTILHELTHFNQTWYQFGADNVRERFTGGSSSRAQDNAESLLWKNDIILNNYLRNRNVGQSSCQCKR